MKGITFSFLCPIAKATAARGRSKSLKIQLVDACAKNVGEETCSQKHGRAYDSPPKNAFCLLEPLRISAGSHEFEARPNDKQGRDRHPYSHCRSGYSFNELIEGLRS